MPLNEIAVKSLKPTDKARKVSDAKGLYLFLAPTGSKLWRYDYRHEGKRKTMSFGAWPKVSLATARGMRDIAKASIGDGYDPSERPKGTAHNSFEGVCDEWLTAQTWVPAHKDRVTSRFVEDVYRHIGKLRLDLITPAEILKLLRRIEARGALDVAKRVRQSIGAVFRYGVATGRASRDPSADLMDAMKPPARTQHMAALKVGEVKDFFERLRIYDGETGTSDAIEMVMHTFVRTNEIRFAKWEEFDGDLWRIPGDRMKMHRDHIVPITAPAKAILARLKKDNTTEWVVPGLRGPISQNTLIYAVYRMGYHSRTTVHGFRGLASTVLNESGWWRTDAIERQLAHVPENQVRSAYNAAQYLDERKRMMAWWSNWLIDQELGLLV